MEPSSGRMAEMKPSKDEIAELQKRYNHPINYESDSHQTPIDPLSYVDSNGDSLLHIAASGGDLRTVELLLKAGIDVDRLGDMGCTALHYALAGDHKDVANFLLAHGASTEIINEFGLRPGDKRK